MRLLADMGVAGSTVEWLRSMGHDVSHLREEDLQRLPNGQIFAKAVGENRIVMTFDLDFGEIAAFSRDRHTSVILFRLRDTRAMRVNERLRVVLEEAKADLESGAVVLVEEDRFRVRRLPLGAT